MTIPPKSVLTLFVSAALLVVSADGLLAGDKTQRANMATATTAPKITHIAQIVTNLGVIEVGLYGQDAPKTVANFVGLARNNFYDSLLVHRIAKDMLIQTGDPLTKDTTKRREWGTGGESIFSSEFEDEIDPTTSSFKLGYEKGTLAMANSGANTNLSQFFICLDKAQDLTNTYTIFGRVERGLDVVETIAQMPTTPGRFGSSSDGQPVEPISIMSVSVRELAPVMANDDSPQD